MVTCDEYVQAEQNILMCLYLLFIRNWEGTCHPLKAAPTRD